MQSVRFIVLPLFSREVSHQLSVSSQHACAQDVALQTVIDVNDGKGICVGGVELMHDILHRLIAIEKFLQKRILQIEEFGEKADDVFSVSAKSGTVNLVNDESLALQIITNLKADPFVSYDELSELLGMPRRTVARRMKELADADRSRRVGAAKNGYWKVLRGEEGTREKGEIKHEVI